MLKTYSVIGNPPPSDIIYERLFNFIDSALLDFNVLSTDDTGNAVVSEDAITEDLVVFLDDKQELLNLDRSTSFRFTNQSQGKSDIGVKFGRDYTPHNTKSFCWIEAKRLPTPINKKRDEREYVVVDKEKFNGNGGIQRFKECKHAPELKYSIMFGYVQDKNAEYWLSKINFWITELSKTNDGFWSNEECLNKYTPSKCDRFLSIHKRKDETTITLHHYWIKL